MLGGHIWWRFNLGSCWKSVCSFWKRNGDQKQKDSRSLEAVAIEDRTRKKAVIAQVVWRIAKT